MYGAILGDMVGAPYEYDMSEKIKDFLMWKESSRKTDDTVMTIAVAEALLDTRRKSNNKIRKALIKSMKKYGELYPYEGYGTRFSWWLKSDKNEPYSSFGNGSAMRVSSAGWLFNSIEKTREIARLTAEVTHNHPEGIKGAESVASVIFLARKGFNKAYIKKYVVDNFGYDLSKTCDEIRPTYHHVESCQETVPQAMTAFFEGIDFEDVIRNAVSLGGDCDTLTCIAGSMAEAYYPIPEDMKQEVRNRLSKFPDLLTVLDRFTKKIELNYERKL